MFTTGQLHISNSWTNHTCKGKVSFQLYTSGRILFAISSQYSKCDIERFSECFRYKLRHALQWVISSTIDFYMPGKIWICVHINYNIKCNAWFVFNLLWNKLVSSDKQRLLIPTRLQSGYYTSLSPLQRVKRYGIVSYIDIIANDEIGIATYFANLFE